MENYWIYVSQEALVCFNYYYIASVFLNYSQSELLVVKAFILWEC